MNKAEKSLRWVVNQIPDFKPTTNEEKMLVAIKLYSEAGAEEIKRLKTENAALRARLDKALVVKAKVDDTIYLPWIYDGVSGVGKLKVCAVHFLMDGSVIYATDLDDGLGEQEIDFLSKYHYGNFSDDDFGIMVFTDEQAAEARLAELKGEKE